MPIYIYEAKASDGKKVTGSILSESKQMALSSLKLQKLYPMKLVEKKDKPLGAANDIKIFEKKVKKKHIAVFTRQFASMLKAGISLPLIMEVLIQQERNATFKKILKEINEDILSGNTLSRAIMKHKVFPLMLVSMVEVGEANGRLDIAFERIALSMEKDIKLAGKIKGAMIYPIVLITISIVVSIILSLVVIPVFSGMFEQMGVPLPATTRTFLNISRFMTTRWYVLAAVVVLLIILILKLMREPLLRAKLDYLVLKIPLIGKVLDTILMARFCRTFSSLIEGGVEVISSLETVSNVITNMHLKGYFNEIINDVRSGSTIFQSAARFNYFPPLVVSMLRIGEESGRLGETLSKTAELYEDEAEVQLQRLTSLLEPTITVIVALMVGFIVLSVVQPMFNMYNIIGK